MDQTFSPRDTLQDLLHGWWFVTIFILVGSAAGWAATRLQSPIYEAKAAISTSIDFSRTGQLTDVEEDYAIGIAGDLIQAPDVLQSVADSAGMEAAAFKQMSSVERENSIWTLRVRSADAKTAAKLANLWAERAYQALTTAAGHGLTADHLQRYLDSLESCIGQAVISEPVNVVCNPRTFEEIQQEITKTGAVVQAEKLAAKGIMGAATFDLSQQADPPTRPVRFNQGLFVLSGACVGAVLGLWLGASGWFVQRKKGEKHA